MVGSSTFLHHNRYSKGSEKRPHEFSLEHVVGLEYPCPILRDFNLVVFWTKHSFALDFATAFAHPLAANDANAYCFLIEVCLARENGRVLKQHTAVRAEVTVCRDLGFAVPTLVELR